MYSYVGHGLVVKKTETMVLLGKTNTDWWKVRKSNGVIGYVPADYLGEVEPKLINVEEKIPVAVVEERGRRGSELASNAAARPEPSEVQLIDSMGIHGKENIILVKEETNALDPLDVATDPTGTSNSAASGRTATVSTR